MAPGPVAAIRCASTTLKRAEGRKVAGTMPLLNFTLIQGRTPAQIRQVLDSAHEAVVEAFDVPERDRYQIVDVRDRSEVIALDTGLGIERTDNLVIVRVTSRRRTGPQKQRFYELLAEKMHRDCGLEAK